jgi:hypothetical protein
MSTALFEDSIRDLNRLVFAAEALEEPDLPCTIPGHGDFANFEVEEDDEDFTREKAIELGKKWQFLAVELADILGDLALDDHANALSELRAKAKAARQALIQIDVYDPPLPTARGHL